MLYLNILFGLIFLVFDAKAFMPARTAYPQIISHRGASGYIPEHSLQAYQTAINLLTDYIEPDLCLTKDGVFVALHDLLLDDTTNVASFPEFADRKTTRYVDGKNLTGFFVSDFTYQEVLELRLKQRMNIRTPIYDYFFTIPTLDQIMSLAQSSFNSTGRTVGLYIELKHPSYFHSLGFNMEDMFLQALTKGGYAVTGTNVPTNLSQVLPIVIQCFDTDSLKYMHQKTPIPLIQLYEKQTSSFWLNKTNVEAIATYAQGIGPEKSDFGNADYATGLQMMEIVRENNLFIHPWTLRADSGILTKFNNDFFKENTYYLCCLAVDGIFTEFPDRTREAISVMANYTSWISSPATHSIFTSEAKCVMDCAKP